MEPKREINDEKRGLWPGGENQGATILGGGKLKKEKTLKVRMNSLDLLELDKIKENLKIAERATAIRWLIYRYDDIKQASEIVKAFKTLGTAQENFRAAVNTKP